MCLICGGLHHTKYCTNSSEYSTDYSSNLYSQPQPYQNYYSSPYQSCNESNYPPYFPTFVESCQVFAQTTSLLKQNCEALEKMLEKMENDAQIINPFCGKCAGPHKYEDCPNSFRWAKPSKEIYWADKDDWTLNQDKNDELVDATKHTNMETTLKDAGGIGEDNKVEQEEQEEKNFKLIIDFSCDEAEIEAKLVEYRRLIKEEIKEELPGHSELSDREPETIMDKIPPPVQQVVNSNHWCPTPWNIDDDFWSDDDEGVVEEIELEVPRYSAALIEEVEEKPLDKMEDVKYHEPSWEEEFGDELVGLPTIENEEFDPIGDLAYLEKLLKGEPIMEIKQIPNEEEEKVAEEFESCPVEKQEAGTPPKLKTRGKTRRNLDQHILRIPRWYKRKLKAKLKCRDNHHPLYMTRIRFGPGKFKYWWRDWGWIKEVMDLPLMRT